MLTCCLLLLPLWESVIVLCCTLLYIPSSFAIILMGKRDLVALLSVSSWCLVIAVWLFLAVPWVCMQFVIVVFPDHTHYFYNQACRLSHNIHAISHSFIMFGALFKLISKIRLSNDLLEFIN